MEPIKLKRPNEENGEEMIPLVIAAKAGDEKAFSELIEKTQHRLFRFLVFLAGDAALANDLCQDTYLYAFEHLKQVTEPRYFLRWLLVVARHKFLDHRKSPRNRAHTPVENLDIEDDSSSPERREKVRQVRKVFAELDPEDREVLALVDIEGYTVAEAAESIKVSASAATSRLRRARAKFHKKFFGG